MHDDVVRQKEIDAFLSSLALLDSGGRDLRILEVGCGNGVFLRELHEQGYTNVTAIDFLPEFVELAKSRDLPYEINEGDVRALSFEDNSFDIVCSERVVINLKDAEDQNKAFGELHRVLKPCGHLLMIEAFEDSLHQLNEARAQLGLPPIPMAHHNRWFKPGELEEWIQDRFTCLDRIGETSIPPRNFLSSHYFMSRAFSPLLQELRKHCPDQFDIELLNSHLVQFFGRTLPPHGNYSAVQFLCLQGL